MSEKDLPKEIIPPSPLPPPKIPLSETKGAGVMLTCKDMVLILQRNKDKDYPNSWNCPGGSAEKEEKPYQTAFRELKEEILNVPNNMEIINHKSNEKYILFHGILEEEFIPIINEESKDWAWVAFSEVFDYNLHPKDRFLMLSLIISSPNPYLPTP